MITDAMIRQAIAKTHYQIELLLQLGQPAADDMRMSINTFVGNKLMHVILDPPYVWNPTVKEARAAILADDDPLAIDMLHR